MHARVQRTFEIVETLRAGELAAAGGGEATHPGQARGGVDTAWRGPEDVKPPPIAVRLSGTPAVDVRGADIFVLSGAATGARIGVLSVIDGVAVFGPGGGASVVLLQPGDTVRVDNSGYLAAETYHRHQVPADGDFAVWDQFRDADGAPRFPQRPLLLGPLFAAAAAGTVQTGRFEGKMIVVASLLDREALPWQADWYRSKVQEHFGEAADEHFRLWFTENALHGDDEVQESPLHTVSYLGVLHQALRDVSRWVEDDVAPPASTDYQVVDGQVVVPPHASARRGIQPVVSLTVDDGERAVVPAGERVALPRHRRGPAGDGCHRRGRVGLRRIWPIWRSVARRPGGAGQRGVPALLCRSGHLLSHGACRFPAGGERRLPVRPSPEPRPCARRGG